MGISTMFNDYTKLIHTSEVCHSLKARSLYIACDIHVLLFW